MKLIEVDWLNDLGWPIIIDWYQKQNMLFIQISVGSMTVKPHIAIKTTEQWTITKFGLKHEIFATNEIFNALSSSLFILVSTILHDSMEKLLHMYYFGQDCWEAFWIVIFQFEL